MKNNRSDKIAIICCALAFVILLASVTVLCVYNRYAMGVSQSEITLYVDGVQFNGRAEVERNSTYEVEIRAEKGVEYYIHVDSQYGYVEDNKFIHISGELDALTAIPVSVTLIKKNYSASTYIYNFIVGPI